MARKIILKEDGLSGSGNAPDGYRYLGYNGTTTSEKAGATVSAICGSTTLTTTVNISSAQIIAMGTTPIELLPDLVGNKMYKYSIVLYQSNSTASQAASFGVSTGLWVGDSAKQRGARVTSLIITQTVVKGLIVPSDFQTTNSYLNDQVFSNKSVILTSWNGSDPNQNLSADVTLTAKITYEVIDLI